MFILTVCASFLPGHFGPGHLQVAIMPFKVIRVTDVGTNRRLMQLPISDLY